MFRSVADSGNTQHRRLRATKIVCSDRAFTHVRYSPPRANRRRESALPGNNIRSPEIARRRTERGDRAVALSTLFRHSDFRADSNHHSQPTRHRTANAQYSRWNPQRLRARGRTLRGATTRVPRAELAQPLKRQPAQHSNVPRTNAPSQAAGCSRSHVAAFSVAVG